MHNSPAVSRKRGHVNQGKHFSVQVPMVGFSRQYIQQKNSRDTTDQRKSGLLNLIPKSYHGLWTTKKVFINKMQAASKKVFVTLVREAAKTKKR